MRRRQCQPAPPGATGADCRPGWKPAPPPRCSTCCRSGPTAACPRAGSWVSNAAPSRRCTGRPGGCSAPAAPRRRRCALPPLRRPCPTCHHPPPAPGNRGRPGSRAASWWVPRSARGCWASRSKLSALRMRSSEHSTVLSRKCGFATFLDPRGGRPVSAGLGALMRWLFGWVAFNSGRPRSPTESF